MSEVTQLLNQIDDDPSQADQLLPLVYNELKSLARARMAGERADHTLQPTALVHEAFVRLVGSEPKDGWDNRGHFFAAAAESMRRILVNHARTRNTQKRGGGWSRVTLETISTPGGVSSEELTEVCDALDHLAARDHRAAEVAKLRIFAGLSVNEIAGALDLGKRSVDRHWAFAKAWLRRTVESEDNNPE